MSHWDVIRKLVLTRDGYACVECGEGQNLHVHHITYRNEGSEALGDLQTLCRGCHSKQPKRASILRRESGRLEEEKLKCTFCLSLDTIGLVDNMHSAVQQHTGHRVSRSAVVSAAIRLVGKDQLCDLFEEVAKLF